MSISTQSFDHTSTSFTIDVCNTAGPDLTSNSL